MFNGGQRQGKQQLSRWRGQQEKREGQGRRILKAIYLDYLDPPTPCKIVKTRRSRPGWIAARSTHCW